MIICSGSKLTGARSASSGSSRIEPGSFRGLVSKSVLVRTSSSTGLSPRSMKLMTWVGVTRKRFFHHRLPHMLP